MASANAAVAVPKKEAQNPFTIQRLEGFPAVLDKLAAHASPHHAFLRSQWFAAAASDSGQTLVARRTDGTPIVSIPLTSVGPAPISIGSVPGSYWPFRSALLARDCTRSELAAVLAHPDTQSALGTVWRMGPVYAEDQTTRAFVLAAKRAGWKVLTRNLGQTFAFAVPQEEWPRKSTLKRLRRYRRKLEQQGAVSIETVGGNAWNDATFETLAHIEAASWVGSDTDGSGAKFANRSNREIWQRAIVDPTLRKALSATILRLDNRPLAFTFDLTCGACQYAIASSFDAAFADFRVGQIVTYAQLQAAREDGITSVDFGAGDSGYKREIGAEASSEIHDLLFVRSRSAAALLRLRWESGDPSDTYGTTCAEPWDDALIHAAAKRSESRDPASFVHQILLAGGLAASTVVLTV